jgi:hypothetical protein
MWAYGIYLLASSPLVEIGSNTFRVFLGSSNGIEDVRGVRNPISIMLHMYGLNGSIAYAVYLRVIFRVLARAQSAARRLVLVRAAFITLLVVGLLEPPAGSGVFEHLLALLFFLARPVENDTKSINHTLSQKNWRLHDPYSVCCHSNA